MLLGSPVTKRPETGLVYLTTSQKLIKFAEESSVVVEDGEEST